MRNIGFLKYFVVLLSIIFVINISIDAFAGNVNIPNTFAAGETAKASEVNDNFSSLEKAVDDNDGRIITNVADITTNTSDISSNDSNIADLSNKSWGKSENGLYYSSGNIGVGTTEPIAPLSLGLNQLNFDAFDTNANFNFADPQSEPATIKGLGSIVIDFDNNANSTTQIFAVSHDDGIEVFRIEDNGNVGIGTTVPNAPLSLGLNQLNFDAFDTNENYNFSDPKSEPATIKGLGSIVIDFDNNANSSTQIFSISHDNGIEVFRIEDSGNVGIGTSSPVATLDVNGFMKLSTNASEPATCDATLDGSLAMTSGHQMCACDGVNWVSTSDGVMSCSW